MDRHRLGSAVTELSDDEVMTPAPRELSDDEVMSAPAPKPSFSDRWDALPPKPFMDRIARGDALQRVLAPYVAAGKGAAEGFGSEPLGLSDEHVHQLREAGVFADPATGRGGAIRFMNEAVAQPISALGDLVTRGFSGGIGAISGAVGQMVEDAEGALGSPQKAKNEVTNFLNERMLRGDHEFGRVDHHEVAGPHDQPIGILPRDADFKTGADVLGSPAAEANLRRRWEEDGIHPAEAVHDAQSDAFLRQEIAPPSFNVFHGSMHEFDRFDISKINTGEGAQSYGHGLYFAENRAVAQGYQKAGDLNLADAEFVAQEALDSSHGNREAALEYLKSEVGKENAGDEAAKLIKSGWEPPKGNLYQSIIHADKEDFLDWDKPLSEQSEYVKERLAGLNVDMSQTGNEFYNSMHPELDFLQSADVTSKFNPKITSDIVYGLGIPGIKYLDEGSRKAGDGTRNIVLFDHNLVEITHKNGVALTPTKLAPVVGSPIPNGTPRSELAKTGDPLIDRILTSPTTQRVIDNPVVDRDHTIPYTAGGSTPLEDPTFFIDRRFPHTFTVEGVTFDPAEPFAIHENVEQHTMEQLTKGGMSHEEAYRVAHFEFAEKAEGAWYRAHGIDQDKAEAAYAPYMAQIQHEGAPNVPANLYKDPYPHDNPSAAMREPIAEPKPSKEEIARAKAILRPQNMLARLNADRDAEIAMRGEGGTRPVRDSAEAVDSPLRAAGADVTRPENLPTLAQQPAPAPGSLAAAMRRALDSVLDFGRDLQYKAVPMATGTRDSMAFSKDFANIERRIDWEWTRIDRHAVDNFDRESRTRMFNAMDEESVAIQKGESREFQGLNTLEPNERAFVQHLDDEQQLAWMEAQDIGMVQGDGIPMHATRYVINIANATDKDKALSLDTLGRNLTVRTPQMRHRKYLTVEETEAAAKQKFGEQATVARDIRAVALSTAKLQKAIIGQRLVNKIEEIGKYAADDIIAKGAIPEDSQYKWVTWDHPALRTWRPKMVEGADGKFGPVLDENGNVTNFEQVPIYVRSDWKGPLKAVLTESADIDWRNTTGTTAYGAMMALKGKTMSVIMNSPLIHNFVILGKVLPAAPLRTIGFYWSGNKIRNDPAAMREWLDAGAAPVGARFFKQDITSMMEEPDLAPGRSWTSQVAAASLTSERLLPQTELMRASSEGDAEAIKAAVDKAGDFWHNTMLWDRVASLQMGLMGNLRDRFLKKGLDRLSASRAAAYFGNIFGGSLPKESMSAGARAMANVFFFSRTFTLSNQAAFKTAVFGLPRDIMAQIERDTGGGINPDAAALAKSIARRKVFSALLVDTALFYVTNSILQNAANVMFNNSTWEKEWQGYAERLKEATDKRIEHPLSLLQPFDFLESVSATGDNEPTKRDRIHTGYDKDGNGIYVRNILGKYPEELIGTMTGPLDMMRRKQNTTVSPVFQILANDKGFGRKVYDPNADTPVKYLQNIGLVAQHLIAPQFPQGQIRGIWDLLHGEGDPKVNAMQAFGPLVGGQFSRGAPGGPQMGYVYQQQAKEKFAIDLEMPDIRKQIQRGDEAGARARMGELHVDSSYTNWVVRTANNPSLRLSGKAQRRFLETAPPDQIRRFEGAKRQ